MSESEKIADQRTRREARRVGLLARRSRSKNVLDNRGGYMLVDRDTGGFPVAGFKYDLSAEDVTVHCSAEA
jgi:hypothetical protein